MKAALRKGERCPVHSSYFCCGRDHQAPTREYSRKPIGKGGWKSKAEYVGNGVWRIPDEYHVRGYRERRNPEAMRRLLKDKIKEQDNKCALCGEKFDDFRQIIPEHKDPKGMGGARRDDHPDNIQAAHHYPCNVEKGSQRL